MSKPRTELIEIPLETTPPEPKPVPLRVVPVGGRYRYFTEPRTEIYTKVSVSRVWRHYQTNAAVPTLDSNYNVNWDQPDTLVYPISTDEPQPPKRITHAELKNGDLGLRDDGVVVRWNEQFNQWFYLRTNIIWCVMSHAESIPPEIVALYRVQVTNAKGGA